MTMCCVVFTRGYKPRGLVLDKCNASGAIIGLACVPVLRRIQFSGEQLEVAARCSHRI